MKQLSLSEKALAAVSMMLIAVTALFWFCSPTETTPPKSQDLTPILGTWHPVQKSDPIDSPYRNISFSLKDNYVCEFPLTQSNCTYTYDEGAKIVSVTLSDSPTETLRFALTVYYQVTALRLDDQYYVHFEDLSAALQAYQWELDRQPPSITQLTEAELTPILGEWKDISGSNDQGIFQAFRLNRDMTCFLPSTGATYPYNYNPSTQTLTIYNSTLQSAAVQYILTQTHGFTMLVKEGTPVMDRADSDKQYELNGANIFFARAEAYEAAHEAYWDECLEGKQQRHQATANILLEGKIPFEPQLPYQYDDKFFIADIDRYYTIYGYDTKYGYDLYLLDMTLYMVTSEDFTLKLTDALQNVRLVCTSENVDWTQEALEERYQIPLTYITVFSEGHGTDATNANLDHWSGAFDAAAIKDEFLSYGMSYLYEFAHTEDNSNIIENPAYQDWFVFFEVYGAEGTFYIQLDA